MPSFALIPIHGERDLLQEVGLPEKVAVAATREETISSGNTAILFSLLAQISRNGHCCALVDASDCFDPASAETAGVDLSRLLWARCGTRSLWAGSGGRSRLKPLEQAFKAADILLQNGGFGMIVVDLGNIEERDIRKVPHTTWFRFARVVEKKPVALFFLTNYPVSCPGLKLKVKSGIPRWNAIGHVEAQSCGLSLGELELEIELEEKRLRKPVQSVRPKFTARPVWG
jgi:hypothetical protein